MTEGSLLLILSLLITTIMSKKFINQLITQNKETYYNKSIQKYLNSNDYNIDKVQINQLYKSIIKHDTLKLLTIILIGSITFFLGTDTNISIKTLIIGMGISYSTIVSIENSIIENLNIKKDIIKKLSLEISTKNYNQTINKQIENKKELSNSQTKEEQIEELKKLKEELTQDNNKMNNKPKLKRKRRNK